MKHSPLSYARDLLRRALRETWRLTSGWRGPLLLALAIAFLPPLAWKSSFSVVRPGQVGVRTNQLGGGVESTAFAPGLHLTLPGIHGWELLDTSTRFAVFGAASSPDTDGPRPLEVRTRDESTARLGLAVPYRMRAGAAPTLVADGLARGWDGRVRGAVETVLRARLSALSTDEWLDPTVRRARASELMPELAERLAPLHAEPLELLFFDVRFHPDFERELSESQVLYQRELLVVAKGRRDAAAAAAKRVQADTTAAVAEAHAERALETTRRRRDHQREVDDERNAAKEAAARLVAEAERDLATARAEVKRQRDSVRATATRRRLELLASGAGNAWLAREAARNLRIESAEVDPVDGQLPALLSPTALAKWLLEE